jgi:hypothetical protein
MSLIAKVGSTSNFKPVPPGMHLGRLYRIIDLGTQTSEYLGKTKSLRKVMLQWEIHSEDDEGRPTVTDDGKPLSLSKNYTLTLDEKGTLRKDLQTWRGRDFTEEELAGFDIKVVLGQWAMLSVIKALGNNGKEYTNVAAVMSVPKSVRSAGFPEPHNDPKIFVIATADMEMFEKFSENLKVKIEASPEWKLRGKTEKPTTGFDDLDDSVPF